MPPLRHALTTCLGSGPANGKGPKMPVGLPKGAWPPHAGSKPKKGQQVTTKNPNMRHQSGWTACCPVWDGLAHALAKQASTNHPTGKHGLTARARSQVVLPFFHSACFSAGIRRCPWIQLKAKGSCCCLKSWFCVGTMNAHRMLGGTKVAVFLLIPLNLI